MVVATIIHNIWSKHVPAFPSTELGFNHVIEVFFTVRRGTFYSYKQHFAFGPLFEESR
jgi:hypothetical protein